MKIIIEGKQGEGKSRLAHKLATQFVCAGLVVDLFDGESSDPPHRYGFCGPRVDVQIYVRQTK
jgi:hypothetical protein